MNASNGKDYARTAFPDPQKTIALAMLGMIPGNGHPYSWSSIINGYDKEKMARCPYEGIIRYMTAVPYESVGIPKARVTHVWTDNPEEAPDVAGIALIPNVVKKPEEVIGEVDAVIVSTDDGDNHIGRAAPFVEAGLPVFVDKPLATNVEDLKQFIAWERDGSFILSSSGMRYAPEIAALKPRLGELGEIRWISSTSAKLWETYGIHALECIYPLTGPGFESIRVETRPGSTIAYLAHRGGIQVTLPVIRDMYGSFGLVQVCGTTGNRHLRLGDTYNTFRNQLLSFIEAVRRRTPPYPFTETAELMAVIIAGRRSLKENNRLVPIDEIMAELES